jgi:hypothetical protein
MIWTRTASLLLFLLLGGYAVLVTTDDFRSAFVLAVADRLERKQPVTADELAAAAARIREPSFGHYCRSDILRPGLVVMLADLGRMNQTADYAAWARANAATEAYLTLMIRCTPSDGNVWLRRALVESVIAEDPKSLRSKMMIARALMPYENKQVYARLYLWKRLSPLALEISQDLARGDIRATLLHGSDDLKTSMRQGMSAAFAALVKSEAAKIAGNPAE